MATRRTALAWGRYPLAALLILASSGPLLRGAEQGTEAASAGRFSLSLSLGPIFSLDSGYRDVFGGAAFYPEIKAAYDLRGPFYLWAAAGTLAKTGTVPEVEEEATSCQTFLSLGGGLRGRLAGRVEYRAEAGLFHAWFSETALGLEESHGRLGWRIEGQALLPLTSSVSAGLALGYLDARAAINDADIIVGGWKVGFVAGYRF